MIKAKVSTDYKDIERIFAGGVIQKEIIKVWSTEANDYVFEAWRVLEMEGPLPLTFKANGEPLIDYRIYGNTEQTGTPTPENPIIPIGCGERTENLLDLSLNNWEQGIINTGGYRNNSQYSIRTIGKIKVEPNTTYTLKNWDTSKFHIAYHQWKSDKAYESDSGWQLGSTMVFTTSPETTLIEFTVRNAKFVTIIPSDIADSSAFSFVLGDVPPDHYIPYGYKLPILSNSTVLYWALTNIYLGEVETTRRIKKLVLTGEETWVFQSINSYGIANLYTILSKRYADSLVGLSSHFNIQTTLITNTTTEGFYLSSGEVLYIRIDATKASTPSELKSYLAAQYAAGTPVTVWYVLAEPETGIVNEPLMKIGDYSDTVDSTQTNVQIPTFKGNTMIDYDRGEKHFITSDGYELVDKNQNGFLLSGSTDSLCPEKMYIKYKGR